MKNRLKSAIVLVSVTAVLGGCAAPSDTEVTRDPSASSVSALSYDELYGQLQMCMAVSQHAEGLMVGGIDMPISFRAAQTMKGLYDSQLGLLNVIRQNDRDAHLDGVESRYLEMVASNMRDQGSMDDVRRMAASCGQNVSAYTSRVEDFVYA